jgi:S-layer protein
MAQIFLKSTNTTYTIHNTGDEVFGANGDQVVTIADGVTGVSFNANVEGVKFQGSTSDYKYQIISRGNLGVFKGTDLIATIPVQDDTNGTVLEFLDGKVEAKLKVTNGALTGLTFGGTNVTETIAPVTPATIIDPITPVDSPEKIAADAAHAAAVSAATDAANAKTAYDTAIATKDTADTTAAATDAAALLIAKTTVDTALNNAQIAVTAAENALKVAQAKYDADLLIGDNLTIQAGTADVAIKTAAIRTARDTFTLTSTAATKAADAYNKAKADDDAATKAATDVTTAKDAALTAVDTAVTKSADDVAKATVYNKSTIATLTLNDDALGTKAVQASATTKANIDTTKGALQTVISNQKAIVDAAAAAAATEATNVSTATKLSGEYTTAATAYAEALKTYSADKIKADAAVTAVVDVTTADASKAAATTLATSAAALKLAAETQSKAATALKVATDATKTTSDDANATTAVATSTTDLKTATTNVTDSNTAVTQAGYVVDVTTLKVSFDVAKAGYTTALKDYNDAKIATDAVVVDSKVAATQAWNLAKAENVAASKLSAAADVQNKAATDLKAATVKTTVLTDDAYVTTADAITFSGNASTASKLVTSTAQEATDASLVPAEYDAKIMDLTVGADSGLKFTGGKGEDYFYGTTTKTFSILDSLDGGAGNDTLIVLDNDTGVATTGIVVKNIESAQLGSKTTVTADTTLWTNLKSLNIVVDSGVSSIKSSATTDVTVTKHTGGTLGVTGGLSQTVTATGGNTTLSGSVGAINLTQTTQDVDTITVDGGTSVSVVATGIDAGAAGNQSTKGIISIGAITAPTGAITVSATSAYDTNSGADVYLGDIGVAGGTTVQVAQTAYASAVSGVNDTSNQTVTQGDVTVTGSTLTTSVTVTQSQAATKGNASSATAGDGVIGVVAGDVKVDDVNAADLTKAGTITTVNATNFGTLAVDSSALTTLSLAGTGTAANISRGALTATPTANTLGLTVTDLKLTTFEDKEAVAGKGFTTLNITAASASTIDTLNAVDATTLTVNGSAKLTITNTFTNLDSLTTVTVANTASLSADLSGESTITKVTSSSTGNNTLKIASTVLTVTGGAGDDSVTFTGQITAGSRSIDLGDGNDTLTLSTGASQIATIAGGSGTNTLVVTDGDFIDGVTTYSNFQVADITAAAAGTLNMSNIPSATTVVAKAAITGNTAITNAVAGTTVSFTAAASSDTTTGGEVSYALKTASGLTDSVTVLLNALDTDAASDDADGQITVSKFTANNIETFNITSSASTTDGDLVAGDYVNTITALVGDAVKTVVLSGSADLKITDMTASTLTKVDASNMTGQLNIALDASANAGAVAVIGGSAADTITMTSNIAANNIIIGNGGGDIITLAAAGTKETVRIAADTDSVLTLTDTTSPVVTPIVYDVASGYDVIATFATGEDKIELSSALGLGTGDARTAITGKGVLATDGSADTASEIAGTLQTLIGTGANFFNDGAINRAVAAVTYNDTTSAEDFVMLFIDTNADGNFTLGTDQAVMITGTPVTPLISDIVFG